jgi:tetratricopeptide (TPR) repeat protein
MRHCFFVILVLLVTKGIAQDTLTSENVEQKSYQLYLDKNWPELIKFGNNAVHKGFDYFYLQLRIGVAYYEKKNYNLAEGHFRKALAFNSADELTQEYLYYCYLFVGRYEEARLWSKGFSSTLAEKIGTNKQSRIGFILLEGGSKVTDSVAYYDKNRKTNSNYYNSPIYFQLGLNHYTKKSKVSIFNAFTYFNQQTFVNQTRQIQYYLKMTIPTKKAWLITPALHWINIKTTTDAKLPPPKMGPKKPPSQTTVSNFSNYFVGSLLIQKNIRKFTVGLGTTVSNMSNVTQFINYGSLAYSVLGNSKLVVGCTGYLHTEDSYSSTSTAVAPFIYTQPAKWVAFKLSYFSNTKRNILEDNGYLVNNSGDLTKSRYSALVNLTLSKHIAIYGLYQLENKQEGMQGFNYRYNVIVGGIKIMP